MTWEDANTSCVSKSMQLFEPRTSEANSAVYNFTVFSLSGKYHNVWLGITDKTDGKYRYESDKQEVGDGMWARDQPNDSDSDDHCVVFGGFRLKSAEWQDYSCSKDYRSICEEI